jgi:arsenite transporter
MVLIWNAISKGNTNYCAVLMVFNSLLQVRFVYRRKYFPLTDIHSQMVLFSPYAILFCNILGSSPGGSNTSPELQLSYTQVARAVGIVCVPFQPYKLLAD